MFANHQIRHQVTSKKAVSLVTADGYFQSSLGICVGMYDLTNSLNNHPRKIHTEK